MVKALGALVLSGTLWSGLCLNAQTIISESGRAIYFNSLDSARGAALNRLASLAACWLENYDPRDSFPVLLDFRPARDSADHPAPELGYDNLFGNSLTFTDSSAPPTDPSQRLYYNRLSLRIRLADSAAEPKTLLHLLEYGAAHYKMLIQIHALCVSDGPGPHPGPVTLITEDIARILSRPLSAKVRTAFKTCSSIP